MSASLDSPSHPTPRRAARWHLAAVLVALGSLGFQLYVAFGPFHAFPFSMDEYGYWYQAEMFASGVAYLPEPPPDLAPLRENYMVWEGGKVFSKYPPGFPAILSIGSRLGAPAAVNPLLAALTLLLLYAFASKPFGRPWALAAEVLMATSPLFIGYSASFFAHPLTLLLVLVVLHLVTQENSARAGGMVALGFVLGFFVWVRPLDALCAGLLAQAALVSSLGWRRSMRAIAIAGVPFVAMTFGFVLYNDALSGRFALSTYPVLDSEFQLVVAPEQDFWGNLAALSRDYVRRLFAEGAVLWPRYFLLPTAFVVPVLGLLTVVFRLGERRWRVALAVHFVALVLLYNFHRTRPELPTWPQYGVRYWYAGLAAVILLAVMALRWGAALAASRGWSRSLRSSSAVGIVAALVVLQLAVAWSLLREYRHRFETVAGMQRDIERRCPGKRLVVLSGLPPPHASLPPFVYPWDLQRNPFFDGEQLFARARHASPKLLSALHGYTLCHYDFGTWGGIDPE